MSIFFTLFYQPIYNLLVWLYDVLPVADIGIPIIITTILVKAVLFPLTYKSLKANRDMQAIQPKIKEIQEKYKEDREKMATELMAVYKEHKVNPFASCLPILIQLPIFLALFRALRAGLTEVNGDILYSFVQNPETINTVFLGFIELGQISIPLAILAAIAQFFQARQMIAMRPASEVRKKEGARDEDMAASMNKMMVYFMPALTLIIGTTSLQGGVMLYWLANTILTYILYALFLGGKKETEKAASV
ncbi:MAG: YidC/Oxa1 family membrane protein insertase [bacterium]|nr:YidC/Oxa1 family membrane protein insertase [bacterium]